MDLYISLLGRLPMYLLLVLSATGVVAGDYFAKKWSIDQKTSYLLLAFFGYFSSSFFYLPTLLKEGLIITAVIWVLLSTIGFLFIGIVIFKESLNLFQILGVGLGVVAIILLAIEK